MHEFSVYTNSRNPCLSCYMNYVYVYRYIRSIPISNKWMIVLSYKISYE